MYAGYRVLEANEGADALAAIRAGNPDLVIIDAIQPAMGGFEFIRQVREDSVIRNTPILLYTAVNEEQATRSLPAKFSGIATLAKPSEPSVVLTTISGLLENPFSSPTEAGETSN
jgi:CheY-like chemotaxis protein